MSDRKVVGGVRLTEGLQVAEFDWVSDTRLVYSIAERIPGREQPAATGEMYAVDYNGKNHAIIYGVRALGERPSLSSRRSAESSYASRRQECTDRRVRVETWRGKKILGAEVAIDKPEIFWLDKGRQHGEDLPVAAEGATRPAPQVRQRNPRWASVDCAGGLRR